MILSNNQIQQFNRNMTNIIKLFTLMTLLLQASFQTTIDQRAKDQILANYNPQGSPNDDVVNVGVQFEVFQVFSENIRENRIDLYIALRIGFLDPRLEWNPSVYSGLTKFVIIDNISFGKKVFVPEILIQSGFEGVSAMKDLTTEYAIIYCTGQVYFSWIGKISIRNNFNIANYPNDVHIQKINFIFPNQGSAKVRAVPMVVSRHSGAVKFKHSLLKESNRFRSLNFELMSLTSEYTTTNWMGRESGLYSTTLTLSRRAGTVNNIMIIPGLLLSVQGFNTYFIQIYDNLRIQFSISNLLSMIVFLTMIIKFLPVNSQISLVTNIFNQLIFNAFCILIFIIIMRYYHEFFRKKNAKYEKQRLNMKTDLYKKEYRKLKKICKQYRKQEEDLMSKPLSLEEEYQYKQRGQKQSGEEQDSIQLEPLLTLNKRSSELKVEEFCKQDQIVDDRILLIKTISQSYILLNKLYKDLKLNLPEYMDSVFCFLFSTIFFVTQAQTYQELQLLKSLQNNPSKL